MTYVNPALLQFTTKKLFRDSMRLAGYLGAKNGNAKVLREQVRQKFKKHMHETDPEKVEQLKKDAVRGLSNYLFYEAQRLAEMEKAEKRT